MLFVCTSCIREGNKVLFGFGSATSLRAGCEVSDQPTQFTSGFWVASALASLVLSVGRAFWKTSDEEAL